LRVRRAVVAGLFYEARREPLLRQVEQAFTHQLGPGRVPPAPQAFTGRVLGIVSPHAGYMYSGPVAAHGYLELGLSGTPETVILVGPNHHAWGMPVAVSEADAWETPLGSVEVDRELCKFLVEESGVAAMDEEAHRYEHSLEVQLPFLQYVFKGGFGIVPVALYLQNLEVSRKLGRAIARMFEELGVKGYVVASSDFTHYEEAEKARGKDEKAIRHILGLDEGGLYDVVYELEATICGYGAIMTLIAAARQLGAKEARLLKYANSGDVTGDYSSVVGYASIAFYRGTP